MHPTELWCVCVYQQVISFMAYELELSFLYICKHGLYLYAHMCGISDYDAIYMLYVHECPEIPTFTRSAYACEIETMLLQMRIQHRFSTMPCECKVMKAASVCSSIRFHCLCRSCQRSNPIVGPYSCTQMFLVCRFGSKQSTAHMH